MSEPNDWIEWGGCDKAPVARNTLVEVRCRDGETARADAWFICWGHAETPAEMPMLDVVAYRVVQP